MKIFIDFDGTLFDTDKYANDFMNIFSKYGIDSVMFNKAKNNLFREEELFNLDIIIDYFIKEYGVDLELKKSLHNLLKNSYLYFEVIGCLEQLKNNGYELYLLTYGDSDFQNMKINSSNIIKYFKQIIITNKEKSELNIDYKNSVFIDNNPFVIEKLYNSNARKLIRIKRDSDRYAKKKCSVNNLIECKDFNEIIQYLKGGFKNE